MQKNRLNLLVGYEAALRNSVSLVQKLLNEVDHNVDIIEADKKIKPDMIRWAKSTLQKPVETMTIKPDYEVQ